MPNLTNSDLLAFLAAHPDMTSCEWLEDSGWSCKILTETGDVYAQTSFRDAEETEILSWFAKTLKRSL